MHLSLEQGVAEFVSLLEGLHGAGYVTTPCTWGSLDTQSVCSLLPQHQCLLLPPPLPCLSRHFSQVSGLLTGTKLHSGEKTI